jgi:hypothetical protein
MLCVRVLRFRGRRLGGSGGSLRCGSRGLRVLWLCFGRCRSRGWVFRVGRGSILLKGEKVSMGVAI